jgi:DNA-binding CsgD family transcriptional regulator
MKSQRIRADDVDAILNLVGEVLELPADAATRQRHFAEAVARLFAARLVLYLEAEIRPNGPHVLAARDCGQLGDGIQEQLSDYVATTHEDDPIVSAGLTLPGREITRLLPELMDRRAWHRSVYFNDVFRVLGLDDRICTRCDVGSGGRVAGLGINRPVRARPFGQREKLLAQILNRHLHWLAPQLNPQTAVAAKLPPRLQQVLDLLTHGLSEKQVARELSISQHTVHDYVKALHKRMGVSSRGELLATALSVGGTPALRTSG